MNFGAVLVVAFLVIMVGLIIVLTVVSQRNLKQFEQACRDRGWQVDHGQFGGFSQTISGSTGGVAWTYEYYRRSSSGGRNQVRTGRLYVPSATLPGDVVLVLPLARQSGQMSSGQLTTMLQSIDKLGGIGRMFLDVFVTQGLGGDASDVEMFTHMQAVQSGSDAFRRLFTVMATSESAADQLLRRGETALVEFAGNQSLGANRHTAVLLWRKGLMLPMEQQVTDVALLEAMSTLITGLANSMKGW